MVRASKALQTDNKIHALNLFSSHEKEAIRKFSFKFYTQ